MRAAGMGYRYCQADTAVWCGDYSILAQTAFFTVPHT